MRKTGLVLLAALFLSGCATMMEMGTQWNNVSLAIMDRKDITGMTKEQMVKEFGPTGRTSVSYNGGRSYETVVYESASGPNIGSRMSVFLVDNVVQNVTY